MVSLREIMPSLSKYYRCLGVNENATQEEIKSAYNKKVLQCHPDKVPGKEEEFRQVHEAYEVLSNPEKRNNFTKPIFTGSDAFLSRFEKEKLFFQMIAAPDRLDHYAYYNRLFKLPENERLIPGEFIQDRDRHWEKLEYVGHKIMVQLQALKKQYPKPDKKTQELIKKLKLNEEKLGLVSEVLLCPNRKLLYDISLDIDHSEEMQEIERLIGGRDSIRLLFRVDHELKNQCGIFCLKKANILTPKTFKQVIADANKNFTVSEVLGDLPDDLVTQANFDRLLQHKKNIRVICRALPPLKEENILNQNFFNIILEAGKDAETVGNNIGWLKGLGILNQETLEMVLSKLRGIDISTELYNMQREGTLIDAHSEMLLWSGSPELSLLTHRIHQMFSYGLFLLSCDVEKGEKSMFLALELKNMLKNFYEMPPLEQPIKKEQFSKDFLKKLHSADDVMSAHREHWKIITANIFIAATVLGLVAIAINRGLFFSKTNRQKQIAGVKNEFLSISPGS